MKTNDGDKRRAQPFALRFLSSRLSSRIAPAPSALVVLVHLAHLQHERCARGGERRSTNGHAFVRRACSLDSSLALNPHTHATMAGTRYAYVKAFERDERLLPDCWIVLRVDGRGFSK